MSDPASKEKSVVGLGEVFRLEAKMAEIVPSVVDGHDDHDQASQDVDGINAADALNVGTTNGDCGWLQG
jgi:hypothetical protein